MVDLQLRAITLQRKRLQRTEPEDEHFDLRWWIDLQFFILALWRLRRAVHLLHGSPYESKQVRAAVAALEAATPSLKTMRDIGEHADEYAIDSKKRRDKAVDRRQLETGSWDGQTFQWLKREDGTQHELNVDVALEAAEALYRALLETQTIDAMPKPAKNRCL